MIDKLDIEEKAQKMECKINDPISILPNNFKQANSKEQLFYGVTEVSAIAYLKKLGFESSMRDCDKKYGIKSQFSEFNSLNILIENDNFPSADIISDLLKTLLKRDIFPKNVEIKVFKRTKQGYKEKTYKGSSSALDNLPPSYWEFD